MNRPLQATNTLTTHKTNLTETSIANSHDFVSSVLFVVKPFRPLPGQTVRAAAFAKADVWCLALGISLVLVMLELGVSAISLPQPLWRILSGYFFGKRNRKPLLSSPAA